MSSHIDERMTNTTESCLWLTWEALECVCSQSCMNFAQGKEGGVNWWSPNFLLKLNLAVLSAYSFLLRIWTLRQSQQCPCLGQGNTRLSQYLSAEILLGSKRFDHGSVMQRALCSTAAFLVQASCCSCSTAFLTPTLDSGLFVAWKQEAYVLIWLFPGWFLLILLQVPRTGLRNILMWFY